MRPSIIQLATLLSLFVWNISASVPDSDEHPLCPIAAAVSNSSFASLLQSIATKTGRTEEEKRPRVQAITEAFTVAGLDVEQHSGAIEGITILGKYRPSSEASDLPIWIVCAHYDVVANTTGLFDNSAGAAALAEAAVVLSPILREHNVKAEVWFIAWDWEEAYTGSWTWMKTVDKSTRKRIGGVWNMDSVGYFSRQLNGQQVPPGMKIVLPQTYAILEKDGFRPDFLAVIADINSGWMANLLNETAIKCDIPIRVLPIVLPLPGATACGPLVGKFGDFCRSDHTAFWEVGIPAIHMTDTANLRNKCYHQPCDDWSYMTEDNWTFLHQMTSILVQSVFDHITK